MLRLYNSQSRSIEEFVPNDPPKVRVYSCGPTVYHYPTIGNWRTYTLTDVVIRVLLHLGYEPLFYMNLTDVGHLTGDNEGDASSGEDRMVKAASREGVSMWEIAARYSQDFKDSFATLGFIEPEEFCAATSYIPEQIDLVRAIEKAGYTYIIPDDGVYFDVEKYELDGNEYGVLSDLDERMEGARVDVVTGRKDPRDFALWKFHKSEGKREMEWESPWGVGFPGWHIECSAMCLANLGAQVDIHIGGWDLKSTHHPNEIAQSEAATGKKPFVNYWLHGAFLTVDGGRMGKSVGNAYTLHDIVKEGIDPLALKYFYYQTHYRKQANFTWEALKGADTSLQKLRRKIANLYMGSDRTENPSDISTYEERFNQAIESDLNMPQALAVLWELVRSGEYGGEVLTLVRKIDAILGLNLLAFSEVVVPDEVNALLKKREQLRKAKRFEESDHVRDEITKLGYRVVDSDTGSSVTRL